MIFVSSVVKCGRMFTTEGMAWLQPSQISNLKFQIQIQNDDHYESKGDIALTMKKLRNVNRLINLALRSGNIRRINRRIFGMQHGLDGM